MSRNCSLGRFLPFLFLLWGSFVRPAELLPDEHTLLLLHCNGDLLGTSAESPVGPVSGVSFETGVIGSGAYLSAANHLEFASAANIDSRAGTLEFWIKPRWNGNDSLGRFALSFGAAGGMLMGKDGGNFWRCIFNRYGAGGHPEVGCGLYVTNEWVADQWHHAAFTWDDDILKVYVDGELRAQQPLAAGLPEVADGTFHLGSDNGGSGLDAVIDELRISDIARSEAEIAHSFLQGLTVTGLGVEPAAVTLLETWWAFPRLTADTNLGPVTIPAAAAQWSSTDPAVAHVDETGKIIATGTGDAIVTAEYAGQTAPVTVTVNAPVLPPETEAIDPFLANPAAGHLYTIPVVILRYLPTTDGIKVDPAETGWSSTLADLKDRIDRMTIQTKYMLEEATRFRGYRNPEMAPSIGYQVIDIVTVYEEFPKGHAVPWNPGVYFPEYNQILTRGNAAHYVNDLGVKEFWIWGYHYDDIEQPESNMSSPLTGDISNSSRFNDDLPILAHTYTVYGYNFTRSACESVHNHGHQLEAILSHADVLQNGNSDLFWKQFVGQDASGAFITGRCGWTHMPPNTTEHYNYWSMDLVQSDIEDWTPDGSGTSTWVNADTWGGLSYNWPDGVAPDDLVQAQWYIYWMQNMPGYGNGIPHGADNMTNWWVFTADWDGSIAAGLGLYGPDATPYGDIDGDGQCHETDAVVLANYLGSNFGSLVCSLQAADVKVDGWIRITDLVVLQNFLIGNVANIPVRH
jgi:hypothetical protein